MAYAAETLCITELVLREPSSKRTTDPSLYLAMSLCAILCKTLPQERCYAHSYRVVPSLGDPRVREIRIVIFQVSIFHPQGAATGAIYTTQDKTCITSAPLLIS